MAIGMALSLRLLALAVLGCGSLVFGVPPAAAATVTAEYVFTGSPSGDAPSGLLADGDLLYGTTLEGGGKGCGGSGCGTAFVFNTATKAFSTLHIFAGGADGAAPNGALVLQAGILYGATSRGGNPAACKKRGCGTVYAINTSTGVETILHALVASQDGQQPAGGLIYLQGMLYGLTPQGAAAGGGSLFSVAVDSGSFTALHSFPKTRYEGPQGPLSTDGTLVYGASPEGGTNGRGYFFSYDPSGPGYRTIGNIGAGQTTPYELNGGLLPLNGILYGTSVYGGDGASGGGFGHGTVFAFDIASGTTTVLHSFDSRADGADPNGGLNLQNGQLYGTTPLGGGKQNMGVIFAVDPTSGAETLVYPFRKAKSGQRPNTITLAGDALYATVQGLGKKNSFEPYGAVILFQP